MLSRASENTLCQILTTLGKGEKDLEIVRQTLCNMEDFTLQQTFLRFDRNGSKSISPQEIVDFMKDQFGPKRFIVCERFKFWIVQW